MCRLADQGDAALAEAMGGHGRERPCLDAILDGNGAQHGLHAFLDPKAQRFQWQGSQFFRLLRGDDPDEAGAVAGKGNLRERAGGRVEFRRNISMLSAVAEVQNDGGLRIGPGFHADAGCIPDHRLPAICPDEEIGRERFAVRKRHRHAVVADIDRLGEGVEADNIVFLLHRFAENTEQGLVGDVPTKCIQADFGGTELHCRCSQQTVGSVYDLHGGKAGGRRRDA